MTRRLGKTDLMVAPVVFGGVILMSSEPEQAAQWISEAIDRGVNYFDVAPSYGNAEILMGPALAPYRKQIHLACKTTERTAAAAQAELERSLERLQTDYFDIYQLHAMTTDDDLEQAFAPGGIMEYLIQARERGLIRHIGFSAHSERIAVKLLQRFDFESVLFPLNWVMGLNTGWGESLSEFASERDIGLLGMKVLAQRKLRDGEREVFPNSWVKTNFPDDPVEDRLALLGMKYAVIKGAQALVPPGDYWHFKYMLDHIEDVYQTAPTEEDYQYLKAVAAVWRDEMILDADYETAEAFV